MKALEAFIANLGITLAGLITIPLAGWPEYLRNYWVRR